MTKYSALFLSLIALSSARVTINRRGKFSLISPNNQNHLTHCVAASTATDVTDGVCKPVTLIFARGTTEPGNMGSVVGPPLATSMQAAFGADKVAVQGVDYPANFAGAGTGATDPKNAAGALNMVAMVAKVAAACPNSKVVLSGYSQGAEQVRGALMNMPAGGAMMAKVAVRYSSFFADCCA
jgi:cutinase